MKLDGIEVKVGDTLFFLGVGEVKVAKIDKSSICIKADNLSSFYVFSKSTETEGLSGLRRLYWYQPLIHYIPPKPKPEIKEWKWVYHVQGDECAHITECFYTSEDDFFERMPGYSLTFAKNLMEQSVFATKRS